MDREEIFEPIGQHQSPAAEDPTLPSGQTTPLTSSDLSGSSKALPDLVQPDEASLRAGAPAATGSTANTTAPTLTSAVTLYQPPRVPDNSPVGTPGASVPPQLGTGANGGSGFALSPAGNNLLGMVLSLSFEKARNQARARGKGSEVDDDEMPQSATSDGTERVSEHSTWATLAEDDVARGLARLAMAAKDDRDADNSKTVVQHYSERLARILEDAEIQFDPRHLH